MDMLLTDRRADLDARCCAMALHDLGIEAISFTGSQAGIITDTVARARRRSSRSSADRVREALAARQGRASSPASRASRTDRRDHHARPRRLATPPPSRSPRALGADVCEIYTDVAGVFTADPRIVPGRAQARRRQLRRDARDGRRRRARCSPCARSSSPATTACRSTSAPRSPGSRARGSARRSRAWKQPIISGVVHDTPRPRSRSLGVPDRPGIAAALFEPLADADVNVDMIVQNISPRRPHRHLFTVPKADLPGAEEIVDARRRARSAPRGVDARRRDRARSPSSARA